MPAQPYLDRIGISAPCTASWDEMSGDERVRHCTLCNLNVYNFSAMSRQEAGDLVRSTEGRLCARFFRREDGTVLTRDCGPVRLAIRRRMQRVRAMAAALLGGLAALTTGCGASKADGPEATSQSAPAHTTSPASTSPGTEVPPLMGEVCVPDERLGRVVVPPQGPQSED